MTINNSRAAPPSSESPILPAGLHTVLIVEDDRLTSTVIRDILTAQAWNVVVAETRAEAERVIAEQDVSLILLDLLLPDADGRDILVSLRARSSTSWLPVVVLTANDDMRTQMECYALGADGFLTKPVEREILKSVVSSKLVRTQQLRREGRVDPLTLLPNRAGFWDAFEKALSLRGDQPLSVCIIDLDHFKSINDTYGHSTGDEALRIVARIFANSLRTGDFVARWGGEEFCVFLPRTEARVAGYVMKRILSIVSRTEITAPNGRRFALTFSAGVASVGDGVGGGDAIAHADRLLYVAKTSGRNHVLSTADSDSPKPRILVAEDDSAARAIVEKVLVREGFEVTSFADGASALSAAATGDFSLAVVDVAMPVMDGFELVRQLRTLPRFAQLPIVMLTGAGSEEDIVRGFALGVSDYVVKPFNRGEFVARVLRLLKSR